MAGREADVEQTLQAQGIKVTGLKVEDRGEVIAIHGSVATESDKQRLEKVVEDTMRVKVANHVTADKADAAMPSGSAMNSELLGQKYTIKSGDTLQKIAKQFYGDERKWKAIRDANLNEIPDADHIHAGATITIPSQAV